MQTVEQIYTNCLAQGSYFVESEGEAFVIDPLRETKPYIDRARERGVKIKYILETHFHADFVSGHIDLAKETGATIVYGPGAETDFEIYSAKDGEELKVGALTLRVLHTPGHTPESTTYLLITEDGTEHAIFTGDTLFIGDVGRPDLAQKATGLTKEDLAGWLYDSLREKILPLPDHVIVYPAHGAGSSCGKNMSEETWDTLGNQKKTNYALRSDMSKEEFIMTLTEGLEEPPQYFAKNAVLNKNGYSPFQEAMKQGLTAFELEPFKQLIKNEDVLLLDVRDKGDFVKSHVPGSLFIGLNGSFAPWVGALITDINQKIVLVTPVGKEEETVRRLARVGYDNALGYLKGGFQTWAIAGEPTEQIKSLSVHEFVDMNIDKPVIDVRKPSEYEVTHICNAINIPLDFFPQNNTDVLDPHTEYFVHCRSGFRSTVASSILKKRGFQKLTNVIGSFDVIKDKLNVGGTCPSLAG